MLASSPWPRTGADSANSASTRINGPSVVTAVQRISLPMASNQVKEQLPSGAMVAEDRSLRVVSDGFLSAVEERGALRWTCDLHTLDVDSERPFFHSFPAVLANGDTVILMRNALVRFDQEGKLVAAVDYEPIVQDSPLSPNISSNANTLFGCLIGDLVIL